jgi:hypothetical protein
MLLEHRPDSVSLLRLPHPLKVRGSSLETPFGKVNHTQYHILMQMHLVLRLLWVVVLSAALAGCQRATTVTASATGTPLRGQAIDAPAPTPEAGTPPAGQRLAPTDPQARAALAVEAPKPIAVEGYRPVTFSELSDFVYQTDMNGHLTPESHLPDEIARLDNTRVAVSGFAMPIEFKGDKVRSLILVRNQLLCCFGEEPKLNEWMFVNIDPPVEAVMDVPVTLFGTLYASPDREENQVVSLYRMQADGMEKMR